MVYFRWFIIWLPILLAEECQVDFLQRKVAVEAASTRPGIKRTYGKYHTSDGDDFDNSLWLFYPLKTSSVKKRPVVVYFHSGGFLNDADHINVSKGESDLCNQKDAIFVTVGYRLLATKYYFTAHGSEHLEEQVHVQSDGRLGVDPDTTYLKFKPHVGLPEYYPKSFYDGVQAFDYVISHADEFGIDPNRVILAGYSAGSGIANYIALIHQSLNPEHFTIKALALRNPQLNYPVTPHMDMAWSQWADFVGLEAPLGSYIDNTSCACVIGCWSCSACDKWTKYPYPSCNESWNALRLEKFCEKDRFVNYTIGDALDFQRWPEHEGSLSARLPLLWYPARNYEALRPNFSIMAEGSYNGTDTSAMIHHTLNVANYARLARSLGIPYVAYYKSWAGMTEEDRSRALRIDDWYLEGSMDLYALLSRNSLKPTSMEDQVAFALLTYWVTFVDTHQG